MICPARFMPRRAIRAFSFMDMLFLFIIIVILAILLLPALGAAREKARRTSCMSNLKQLAVATMSYTSDYGNYFPSSPFWNDKSSWLDSKYGVAVTTTDAGLVRTHKGIIRTGAYSGNLPGTTHNNNHRLAAGLFRTIFVGSTDVKVKGKRFVPGARIGRKGELRLGPTGLGMLLASGYVADGKMMYCPTANDSMPGDKGLRKGKLTPFRGHATKLSHLKRAGGFSGQNIMYGDWSWAEQKLGKPDKDDPAPGGLAILSNYNYRLVPTTVMRGSIEGSAELKARPRPFARLGNITPKGRAITPSAPLFKTEKMLRGRALISDSFSNDLAALVDKDGDLREEDRNNHPGKGHYTHRDGYNVLYGDGHAGWYGDPRRTIMWMRPKGALMSIKGWGDAYHRSAGHLSMNNIFEYENIKTNKSTKITGGPVTVWHMFDIACGIDFEL
jgi:prepilin-type processing-associated H-X9-DG protein